MKLLVGVTGGIAAYKAADLVSRATKAGWSTRVVMTPNATRFVGSITFEALSGHPVMLDTFAAGHGREGVSAVEHINWAKWADCAVVAPMTANCLAKFATGIADDALTTVWMALPVGVPSLLCPAMNTAMWEQPVVVRNLRWIDELKRHQVLSPISKRLACGDLGVGGLAEVDQIMERLHRMNPG